MFENLHRKATSCLFLFESLSWRVTQVDLGVHFVHRCISGSLSLAEDLLDYLFLLKIQHVFCSPLACVWEFLKGRVSKLWGVILE